MYSKRDKWQRLTFHFPLIMQTVMKVESKIKCPVLDGMGILIVNFKFLR